MKPAEPPTILWAFMNIGYGGRGDKVGSSIARVSGSMLRSPAHWISMTLSPYVAFSPKSSPLLTPGDTSTLFVVDLRSIDPAEPIPSIKRETLASSPCPPKKIIRRAFLSSLLGEG
jgi:hypothetical protein